ncbi:MAG: isopentenyl phosphate kinase [Chloroflexota bacterium]
MTTFLKLGGSLITDKTKVETVRFDVLGRVALEIKTAIEQNPGLRLVVGHGSGSFGHVAAAKHGTRTGVYSPEDWVGFTEVSVTASRLNKIVVEALQAAGVPALTLQPSASAVCQGGKIVQIADQPVRMALDAGLVPVVHGDVAFDEIQGGTIVSTEEVMMALANALQPSWLLLAGETEGVYDETKQVIPLISEANFESVKGALGGSRGTDVTGGMIAKVQSMLALVDEFPSLKIRIFSGLNKGSVLDALGQEKRSFGTEISKLS